ncbi:MAG: glucose-6-phosphate isomerase [Desulfitobacteriia bacterium]
MVNSNWQRFRRYLVENQDLGFQLDISRVNFGEDYLFQMSTRMESIYPLVERLEQGEIFNPDEGRMVGHYWLRNPELAPTAELTAEITNTIAEIKKFTARIHSGDLCSENGKVFKNVLVLGIGGSSLGPKFLSIALQSPEDKTKLFFIDNTDPDGMDIVFRSLEKELDQTLTIVISKSGSTIETRNAMEETKNFYRLHKIQFSRQAISITQPGSLLDQQSKKENWLTSFPMWDWVGGRTSVLSAVGLVPLALQGINIDDLLYGAKLGDELTRLPETEKNPAALLALMWYYVTEGQGGKEIVILPYKDRLQLLTSYLQQLIMESLGKEKNLKGETVQQGITVYGNKGSTDQHSYLQQLLDGPNNFLVIFIEVLKDRDNLSIQVTENSTSGDYLQAFLLGTRQALSEKGRQSLTITLREINAQSLGGLIALFERAVTIYALLINVNAYHQPAVELGKKRAAAIISLKNKAHAFLKANKGREYTLELLAENLGKDIDKENLYKILQHLSVNPETSIRRVKNEARRDDPFGYSYRAD